jgi:branched-chain amino acid aminotransferase
MKMTVRRATHQWTNRSFDEVLAVGTAVVITPVSSITRLTTDEVTKYTFGVKDEIGATTRRLYDRVRAIQNGEEEDKYH